MRKGTSNPKKNSDAHHSLSPVWVFAPTEERKKEQSSFKKIKATKGSSRSLYLALISRVLTARLEREKESPVIKLGIRHPRKKERKKVST